MRILLFCFGFAALVLTSCNDGDDNAGQPAMRENNAGKQPSAITTIQWLDSARNYGKINEGQKLAVSFRFKNTGKHPLIIQSVTPSCGCTVADYPRQPVAPGEEAEITGQFDSQGREGLQHKELTVRTNTQESEQRVYFDVIVVKKGDPSGQEASFNQFQ